MKKYIYFVFLLFIAFSLQAQIRLQGYQQEHISPNLYEGRWDAHWISVPDEPANVYGIYHFRKNFELGQVPEEFYVHVTADNRYKLYVNGQFVVLGSARSDIYNWNFETVDLAPYLQKGENVLAAVVWNYAELKPVAQMSFNQTGFLLQGNTATEAIVNTNASWICIKNESYSPCLRPVYGYYVAGPGEEVHADKYPWGWETSDYDDRLWKKAHAGIQGAMKGSRDYPCRLLVPAPIPPMEMKEERLSEIRLTEGIRSDKKFLSGQSPMVIPANSSVRLLLDQGYLTTGYLSLFFSKGKNAAIQLSYGEGLFKEDGINKGDRNEIEGKKFQGNGDRIIADGGTGRSFTTLWWRTWRYINVEITTADEPLVLEDLYGTYSKYPFELEAAFHAPKHDELSKILEIGWRTARLCANETYMDTPYYEQLQYFGDTRIQALITLYNTRDPYLVKNALEQGRQSIVADGITMSRYPSNLHQFISSFSLIWICTGHDYWMYRGDEEYVKTLLPAHRNILAWYEQWLKPDYSLKYIPNWFFADWAAQFGSGEPPREKDGNSAFQDILYLMTLEMAANMEKAFGIGSMGAHYNEIASSLRKAINKHYWDEERGLFADTKDRRSYSQHVNSLAIISKVIEGDQAKEVMKKTLTDKSLTPATIYFTYYVNQALSKAGLGDLLLDNLSIWKEQMSLNLTTWAEQPEPSRSDCHAWSASPNIEFYRIVLGIDSDAPGFRKIRIAPSIGELKEASGSIPHPAGTIRVHYKIEKKGKLKASVTLPQGTSGTFIWKGQEYPLKEGEQMLEI